MERVYAYQLSTELSLEDSLIHEEQISLDQDMSEHRLALNTIQTVVDRISHLSSVDTLETAINLQIHLERGMQDLKVKEEYQSAERNATPYGAIYPDDREVFNFALPSSVQYMNRESVARIQRLRMHQLQAFHENDSEEEDELSDEEEEDEDENLELNFISFHQSNSQAIKAQQKYKYVRLKKNQRRSLQRRH